MAELHELMLVQCRRNMLRNGFKETKSPMPTFRPDVFAEKTSRSGRIIEQLAIEAEIKSTLFSEHTTHQLVLMDEYILHQKGKKIKVTGYLVIPKGKGLLAQAKSLLDSIFPEGSKIKVLQKS